MSITCRDIIDAAFGLSTFTDPGSSATDRELVGVIDRYMRRVYSDAARIDKVFFGASVAVVGVAGVWTRPSAAEVVHEIKNAVPTKVFVVPFDMREEEAPPRVYRFGGEYRTVGLTGDPASTDTLTFYYSKRHPSMNGALAANHATNTLDSTFPEQFFDMPVIRCGIYLAKKDKNLEQAAAFKEDLEEAELSFVNHVQNQNIGVRTRFGNPQLVPTMAKPRA